MKLTYKFNYYNHFNELNNFCKISKNLYNQANYIIKKELKENNKWIRYNELDKIMKTTKNLENEINYYKLKAQTNQQILKLLDKNWISFFRSIKDWKKNKDKYEGMPRPPRYKKNINLLIFTNQNCKIKDNKLYLYKDLILNIPFYKNKDFSNFQQIRILPKTNYHEIEIIYNEDIKNVDLDYNKYSSIDLGINNLVSLISENKPILISGKILKSINQFYNKQKVKLHSIKDKMKIRYTKKLYTLEKNRNQIIKDYLHKTSRFIVNYLIKNKIGNIVVGYNKTWKTQVNLGKRNNQTFVTIPYLQLINYIKYKCELVGINFQTIEESYTSKCDSLALEKLEKKNIYLGKRIKRGLFQSSIGKLINADVNGALNILRKVINDSFLEKIINSGFLFNPVKIRNMFSISLQRFLLDV